MIRNNGGKNMEGTNDLGWSKTRWQEKGLQPKQAAELEEKIGKLKGPGRERLVKMLLSKPDLAKKYTDSQLSLIEFLTSVREDLDTLRNKSLLEDLSSSKEAINDLLQELELANFKELLDEYCLAIRGFINPPKGSSETIGDKAEKIQMLGKKLDEGVVTLFSLFERPISLDIKDDMAKLNSVIEMLENSNEFKDVVTKLKETLKKLENLASLLGITASSEDWKGRKGPIKISSAEVILKQFNIVSFEEGSIASELIRTGAELQKLYEEFKKANFEVAEESQKTVYETIESQMSIVAENCQRVAFLKAFSDFLDAVVDWVADLVYKLCGNLR